MQCDPAPCDPNVEQCDPAPVGDVVQGKIIYEAQCELCHGADGTASFAGIATSVVVPIRDIYADPSVLVAYNETDMPYTGPANCVGVCAEDVTAYLYELNKTFLLGSAVQPMIFQ
jgi:mono/diheme cytochrome c family protein